MVCFEEPSEVSDRKSDELAKEGNLLSSVWHSGVVMDLVSPWQCNDGEMSPEGVMIFVSFVLLFGQVCANRARSVAIGFVTRDQAVSRHAGRMQAREETKMA
jgi:hypothetical protein